MRQDIFFLLLILLMSSCNNRTNSDEDQNLVVKIENGSGDDFSYKFMDTTHFFAPYPFNVGQLKNQKKSKEIMVISKHLDKGDIIDVLPLAKLDLESASTGRMTVILAVPTDRDLSIISSHDFDDFVVSHFGLKQIVEFWYSNRYGLQGTRVIGWSPASSEDLVES